jgi:tetratricopeptide (TPR) repeat protein
LYQKNQSSFLGIMGDIMGEIKIASSSPNSAFVPNKMTGQAKQVDLDFCAQQVERAGRFLEAGNIDGAEAALRQGLERMPENPECLAYLAVCLAAGKRKFVTAEKLVKNIIKNNPYDPTAWYALGRINLLGGRRQQAFKNFEQAKRVAHDDRDLEVAVEKMDPRKGSVIGFLPRNHFLNIWLGRIRAQFSN